MGRGTDISQALQRAPISAREADDRRLQELEIRAPEAMPDGEIVDRPAPAAAPVPVTRADVSTWD